MPQIQAHPETSLHPARLLRAISMGYSQAIVEHHWGEFGTRGKSLRFTTRSLLKLGLIMGFIDGLSLRDTTAANCLAGRLFHQLDYLANYGGVEDGRHRLPRFVVELADDGTFGGFTVAWYRLVPPGEEAAVPANRFADRFTVKHLPTPDRRYAWAMNGALIYHWDYSSPDTDAVVKGDWCTHT